MLPDFGPILYGKTVFSVRLFCLQVLMQKQINYDKLSRNYVSSVRDPAEFMRRMS